MPPRHRSQYLVNEPPIPLYPSLAVALDGSDRALILQQLNYWLNRSEHLYDGRYWVYNTYPQWQEQFPWISLSTLRRHLDFLEEHGLVLSGNFNKVKTDRTKWYTIDDDAVGRFLASANLADPSAQNGQMTSAQNGAMHPSKLGSSVPETPSEINQESDERFLKKMKDKYRLPPRDLEELVRRHTSDGKLRQAALWGELATRSAPRR